MGCPEGSDVASFMQSVFLERKSVTGRIVEFPRHAVYVGENFLYTYLHLSVVSLKTDVSAHYEHVNSFELGQL